MADEQLPTNGTGEDTEQDKQDAVAAPANDDSDTQAAFDEGHTSEGSSQPSPVPLVPPEDCEKVTNDGFVLKKVLEEGTGDCPSLHARCLVHYEGRICSNGDVFMRTRTETRSGEPVAVVAGRDSAMREAGLNLAVAKMRKGERALVYVTDPKYGYGEQGSFSFPSVPPNATLVYDITLMEWESAKESPERAGMLFEERLEFAERRRVDGNTLFQNGQYKEALSKYAVALSYLDEDFLMQLEGVYLDKAHAVKLPIHLNMAACQIKIEDWNTAIYNCDQVLTIEANNVKALFRRGKARHVLGQTEGAQADLEAALKLDPKDAGIMSELRTVRQTIKEERQAEAKLFKGSFGEKGGKMELYPEQQAPRAAPSKAEGQAAAQQRRGGSGPGGLLGLMWGLVGALPALLMRLLGVKQAAQA